MTNKPYVRAGAPRVPVGRGGARGARAQRRVARDDGGGGRAVRRAPGRAGAGAAAGRALRRHAQRVSGPPHTHTHTGWADTGYVPLNTRNDCNTLHIAPLCSSSQNIGDWVTRDQTRQHMSSYARNSSIINMVLIIVNQFYDSMRNFLKFSFPKKHLQSIRRLKNLKKYKKNQ